MFSRNSSDESPIFFPEKWQKKYKQVLLNTYGDKCLNNEMTFNIWALTYPAELVLIVSYLSLDPNQIPLTYFVSADLPEEKNAQKFIDLMFDSAGIFFDNYFASQDDELFEEYQFEWNEFEFSGAKLFYRATRENIELTLEAEKLLNS